MDVEERKAMIVSYENVQRSRIRYKILLGFADNTFTIYKYGDEIQDFCMEMAKRYPDLGGYKLLNKKDDKRIGPEGIKAEIHMINKFIGAILLRKDIYSLSYVSNFFSIPMDNDSSKKEKGKRGGCLTCLVAESLIKQIILKVLSISSIIALRIGSRLTPKRAPSNSINDFQPLFIIGKGCYGDVLLSKYRYDCQLYVIKTIKKSLINEEVDYKHVMAEKCIFEKKMENPFLVKPKCIFQSTDCLYLVMDYVSGGEIFYHLQRNMRFSEETVRFYATELITALEHLHISQVIYRDLKPENILLDDRGHIVLIDFGLARDISDTSTMTFCGTPEYLAPEILQHQSYGIEIDWWCLGCIIYEMLVGIPPFYSRNRMQMFDNILHMGLEFPKDVVSKEAQTLISGLLCRERANRFGAAQIKAHGFFKNIRWTDVYKKEYSPPFIPKFKSKYRTDYVDPSCIEAVEYSSFDDTRECPAGNDGKYPTIFSF